MSASDGTRLFFGEAGSGPWIVLCDGLGCDGFAWRYLQPQLERHASILHWNYRGHGRSGAPLDTARLGVPDLADDLLELLDQRGIEEAVLVGHSLGTQVCLETFRKRSSAVTAMVLICGSYGRVTETFHGSDLLKNVLPGIVESVSRHRLLARALWGRLPTRVAFRLARLTGEVDRLSIREEDFRTYWEHVNLMNPETFLSMLRLAGEHSAEDLLQSVTTPTLVIAAERDTFTPKEMARTMAEQIPDADFLMIDSGSHAAPVEQPQLIFQTLRNFLSENVPAFAGSSLAQLQPEKLLAEQ